MAETVRDSLLEIAEQIHVLEQGAGLRRLNREYAVWQSYEGVMPGPVKVTLRYEKPHAVESGVSYAEFVIMHGTDDEYSAGIGKDCGALDDDPFALDVLNEVRAYQVHPHKLCIAAFQRSLRPQDPAAIKETFAIVDKRRLAVPFSSGFETAESA